MLLECMLLSGGRPALGGQDRGLRQRLRPPAMLGGGGRPECGVLGRAAWRGVGLQRGRRVGPDRYELTPHLDGSSLPALPLWGGAVSPRGGVTAGGGAQAAGGCGHGRGPGPCPRRHSGTGAVHGWPRCGAGLGLHRGRFWLAWDVQHGFAPSLKPGTTE